MLLLFRRGGVPVAWAAHAELSCLIRGNAPFTRDADGNFERRGDLVKHQLVTLAEHDASRFAFSIDDQNVDRHLQHSVIGSWEPLEE